MSKYSQPYHGPHVVFSREEIERLYSIVAYLQGREDYTKSYVPSVIKVDNQIRAKLDAAKNSHPELLTPAK